jgi:hypothetical protein
MAQIKDTDNKQTPKTATQLKVEREMYLTGKFDRFRDHIRQDYCSLGTLHDLSYFESYQCSLCNVGKVAYNELIWINIASGGRYTACMKCMKEFKEYIDTDEDKDRQYYHRIF